MHVIDNSNNKTLGGRVKKNPTGMRNNSSSLPGLVVHLAPGSHIVIYNIEISPNTANSVLYYHHYHMVDCNNELAMFLSDHAIVGLTVRRSVVCLTLTVLLPVSLSVVQLCV